MSDREAPGGQAPGEIREGSIEIGLRRIPELDPAPLPESEHRLGQQITNEIHSSGPMTFARFMEIALYDPAAGYYTTGDAGPGREGDFLTAPEGHPIFGWTLARHLESVWETIGRPSEFVVREHGAGSGALAAGILEGLRRSGSPLLNAVRYQPIDLSPARLDALRARLSRLALDANLATPDDRPAPGAILANELLDALPVHRVEGGADGELLERFVTLPRTDPNTQDVAQPDAAASHADSWAVAQPDAATSHADSWAVAQQAVARPGLAAFSTVLGPPSNPALAARLAVESITLQPGQPAEVCLALDGWIGDAAAPLERGVMLLIDYGAPGPELYTPDRGSTLRAYHHHRVHAEPLVAIGRQDLTAHVDLTAVERAAVAAGLEPLGQARQADFLAALGIGKLLVGLQSDPASTLESYLAARSAVVRMLDPRATGAFTVLAFGRGLPAGSRFRGLV